MRIPFPRHTKTLPSHLAFSSTSCPPAIAGIRHPKKEPVIVIIGATGTGKSKLSIDLALRLPAEIINADKIQIYRGLDITTNKLPFPDRRGVPHHLLGDLDPAAGELPPATFRSLAADAIADISSRGKIPIIAGGSNSYIRAIMVHQVRARSCLLWVHVEPEVLAKYLDKRVDEMVGLGMVEELERYFAEGAWDRDVGLRKAIGVPEFAEYFRRRTDTAYRAAVEGIKGNTRRLAEAQVGKIERMRGMGWGVRRVDATAAVVARMEGDGAAAEEGWGRDVLGPSLGLVEEFAGHMNC